MRFLVGADCGSDEWRRLMNMHGKLRIAIPIHSLEPGGVERCALNLATHWQECGHDVTIVLGRRAGDQLCCAPALDYFSLPMRWSTAAWETPWMVHCLYTFLLENRVDVLFCPGNTYAVVGAAMTVLLGSHAPASLLKVSNALDRRDMHPIVRKGYEAWVRAQGSVFDAVVALSEPMRGEIQRLMTASPGKARVIPNPILPRRRLAALARIERRPASVWGMKYLAAGRLVAQKNYPLMLRAFARVARAGDRLTIAGEGEERQPLEALARELGIASQVIFAGHVASIDPLLGSSDALVLSSDYEGLPGVVVEALAAGLPVLATDCCVSMADIIENGATGLLVPTGAEEELARGFERLRHFPGDARLARTVARTFELERAADRYLDLMHDMVRRKESERRRLLDLSSVTATGDLRHRF